MSPTPLPVRCGSFKPGHEVHWIQGLRSAEDDENRPLPGRLLEVDDAGRVVVEVAGDRIEFWNHEPARLMTLVDRNEGAILVQERWSLLKTRSSDGHVCFSVCRIDSPWRTPCPSADDEVPTDLVSALVERGGFSIPSASLPAATRAPHVSERNDASGR